MMSYEVRSERATRARRRGVGEVWAVRSSLGCDAVCVFDLWCVRSWVVDAVFLFVGARARLV